MRARLGRLFTYNLVGLPTDENPIRVIVDYKTEEDEDNAKYVAEEHVYWLYEEYDIEEVILLEIADAHPDDYIGMSDKQGEGIWM